MTVKQQQWNTAHNTIQKFLEMKTNNEEIEIK